MSKNRFLKINQYSHEHISLTEGTTEYTTCAGLLTTSSSTWPNSSLFQIAASGVPVNKLVIGKPANSGDASNGYIDPSTLAGCLAQAKAQGWSAGAMVWEVWFSLSFYHSKHPTDSEMFTLLSDSSLTRRLLGFRLYALSLGPYRLSVIPTLIPSVDFFLGF